MENCYSIRGTELYVELAGAETAPPLLYLHGGPGTSCYDFMNVQKERLSSHFRLIAFDQRGVLRSQALADAEPLGIDDLIEDCEALRKRLGIEKWSVLGHSFGGYLALAYGLKYPESIDRFVFETPSFDFVRSMRSLLQGATVQYTEMGDAEQAARCEALSHSEQSNEQIWQEFLSLLNGLGARRARLYEFAPAYDLFDQLVQTAPVEPSLWQKAGVHSEKIFAEGRWLNESLLPYLSAVRQPALLICGASDYVTDAWQRDQFLQDVALSEAVLFAKSGHFPHLEEPDRFAEVVTRFLLAETSAN